uniref:VIT domain-containing protein n=1 Tax=Anabas testudineus TaxID=64144 RepID=A0A3Q1ISU1_ANATE
MMLDSMCFPLCPSFKMVEVQSIKVLCTVTSRFAHTVMTSKALNKAKSSQEIFFEVELPKTAFITNFTMEIDGQVHNGEVKEKENAKQEYDQAVSTGQTAGLVKASGRKMETFSVSVSIAAKSSVTFILIYEELLQRKQGQYELLTRVKPKQHVLRFEEKIRMSSKKAKINLFIVSCVYRKKMVAPSTNF